MIGMVTNLVNKVVKTLKAPLGVKNGSRKKCGKRCRCN